MKSSFAAFLIVLAGCLTKPGPNKTKKMHHNAPTATQERVPRKEFADSQITPLAKELASLTLAILQKKPLPYVSSITLMQEAPAVEDKTCSYFHFAKGDFREAAVDGLWLSVGAIFPEAYLEVGYFLDEGFFVVSSHSFSETQEASTETPQEIKLLFRDSLDLLKAQKLNEALRSGREHLTSKFQEAEGVSFPASPTEPYPEVSPSVEPILYQVKSSLVIHNGTHYFLVDFFLSLREHRFFVSPRITLRDTLYCQEES